MDRSSAKLDLLPLYVPRLQDERDDLQRERRVKCDFPNKVGGGWDFLRVGDPA